MKPTSYLMNVKLFYCLVVLATLPYLAQAENQTVDNMQANQTSTTYKCMKSLGYNPDSVVFVYSNGRGGSRLLTFANTAARRGGIEFININNGLLKDGEIRLLQCFFGKYRQGDREFTKAPRLLCAKNGFGQRLYLYSVGMRDFSLFGKRCREYGVENETIR